MHDYHFDYSGYKKQEMVKFYSMIALDVFLGGLIVYNWIVLQIESFAATMDVIEKTILFICTLILVSYRIYLMHQESQKRALEIRKMKQDLSINDEMKAG